MNELVFIRDTIYDLKMDYGSLLTVTRRSVVNNVETGVGVVTDFSFDILQAIALPTDRRQAFLRSIGIHKEGYLQKGEREFLIDKDDMLAGRTVEINDIVTFYGGETDTPGYSSTGTRGDVTGVEDYLYAYVVTVKEIKGMPTP